MKRRFKTEKSHKAVEEAELELGLLIFPMAILVGFYNNLNLVSFPFSVMISAGVHDYANYFLDKMSTHREWRRNRALNQTVWFKDS